MTVLANRSLAGKGAVSSVRAALFNDTIHNDGKDIEGIAQYLEEIVQRVRRLHTLADRFQQVTLSPHMEAILRSAGKEHLLGRIRP